jgi:hypothetical protein
VAHDCEWEVRATPRAAELITQVLGIYCADKADRETIAHLMHLSLGTSYGANYRGSDEVLVLCWDLLDAGGYPHGIAPWRESMAALGRNIWL